MKILWVSNAPWASTGYGQQTALMLPRLRDAGHDVACMANYGLHGSRMDWDGFTIYPAGADWSNDMIAATAEEHFQGEPGWVIVLYDAWTLDSPKYHDLNLAVWCPVDHMPLPRLVKRHFTEYQSVPIAMSRFGELMFRADGLEPLYAPHGIDTKIFYPRSKAEARAKVGLDPGQFLVGMVSTNNSIDPCRKAYPEAFLAFRRFLEHDPDALLYVHAFHGTSQGGIDLEPLATARGIDPKNLVFVDQYRYRAGMISPEEMAWTYSLFDVLLFPSLGEGFGIPAVEAQACGVPIIVSDYSAQAELVGPGSLAVPVQESWDPSQLADWGIPNVEALEGALIARRDDLDGLGDKTIERAEWARQYDANTVFDTYWVGVLADLEARLPSVEPIRVDPLPPFSPDPDLIGYLEQPQRGAG